MCLSIARGRIGIPVLSVFAFVSFDAVWCTALFWYLSFSVFILFTISCSGVYCIVLVPSDVQSLKLPYEILDMSSITKCRATQNRRFPPVRWSFLRFGAVSFSPVEKVVFQKGQFCIRSALRACVRSSFTASVNDPPQEMVPERWTGGLDVMRLRVISLQSISGGFRWDAGRPDPRPAALAVPPMPSVPPVGP